MQQPYVLKIAPVYCSTEDDKYDLGNLIAYKKNSKGWRSGRFCNYPQEIVLRFDGKVRVKRIKILSHEDKISKKIEVYTANFTMDDDFHQSSQYILPPHDDLEFKKIGFISFSDNKENNLQPRELKKVSVDFTACYIKFKLHEPHQNDMNVYNQVSLIGLQFTGTLIQPFPENVMPPIYYKKRDSSPYYSRKQKKGGGMDYDMPYVQLEQLKPSSNEKEDEYDDTDVDEDCKLKIEELKVLKQQAVDAEEYLDAQKYHEHILSLRKVSIILKETEKSKEIAVRKENYAKAHFLKDQIEKLREDRLRLLEKNFGEPEYANVNKKNSGNTINSAVESNNEVQEEEREKKSITKRRRRKKKSAFDEMFEEKSNEENQESLPRISRREPEKLQYEKQKRLYDSIPIKPSKINFQKINEEVANVDPVSKRLITVEEIRRANQEANNEEQDGQEDHNEETDTLNSLLEGKVVWEIDLINEIVSNLADEGSLEKLEKKQRTKEFDGIVSGYGDFVARALYSCRDLRETSLKILIARHPEIPISKAQLFQSTCNVCKVVLKDKLMSVFSLGCDLLDIVLLFCIDEIKRSTVQLHAEPVVTTILGRLNELNPSIKQRAEKALLVMSQVKYIGPLVMNTLIKPPKDGKAAGWKPLSLKIEMLCKILQFKKLTRKSAITYNQVLEFCASCLANPNGKVRGSSSTLIAIINHLQPFDYKQFINELQITPSTKKEAILQVETKKIDTLFKEMQEYNEPSDVVGNSYNNELMDTQEHSNNEQEPENVCLFCKQKFSEDESTHFLNSCPMVIKCKLCGDMINIELFQHHCETSREEDKFGCEHAHETEKCPTCFRNFPKDEYEDHINEGNCHPPSEGCGFCPFCSMEVRLNQESFLTHVLDICPCNPKRKRSSSKRNTRTPKRSGRMLNLEQILNNNNKNNEDITGEEAGQQGEEEEIAMEERKTPKLSKRIIFFNNNENEESRTEEKHEMEEQPPHIQITKEEEEVEDEYHNQSPQEEEEMYDKHNEEEEENNEVVEEEYQEEDEEHSISSPPPNI
ncbi:hypothetical protein ABK040_012582 [Willaertia magna]